MRPPAPAAPELLLGEEVSEKCDIYSLGVVLWEIVTHVSIPFQGGNGGRIGQRQCQRVVLWEIVIHVS